MNNSSDHDLSYDETGDSFDDRPSKSQIKRDLLAILDLGKEIVALPEGKVKQLPLSEHTREEIFIAQKIHAREGKRRQVHYIGKLLRKEDTEAIRQMMMAWAKGSREQTAAIHRIETLRDRLIQQDSELTLLIERYPHMDIQRMRTLIRAARKEQVQHEKNPTVDPQRKNYRALFQELKQLLMEN